MAEKGSTRTAYATSESKSLRTTVPAFVVKALGLKVHSKLTWQLKDGAVIVRKSG